jgi:hypothetical protein
LGCLNILVILILSTHEHRTSLVCVVFNSLHQYLKCFSINLSLVGLG